jgi:hypothetical protein
MSFMPRASNIPGLLRNETMNTSTTCIDPLPRRQFDLGTPCDHGMATHAANARQVACGEAARPTLNLDWRTLS